MAFVVTMLQNDSTNTSICFFRYLCGVQWRLSSVQDQDYSGNGCAVCQCRPPEIEKRERERRVGRDRVESPSRRGESGEKRRK